MSLPRLKTRPQSVHTCTRFRGLDRRPGASSRSRNNTWDWHWHDERNLSADRYPRLSVRTVRTAVESIDGNNPVDDIVAMCGGDHLVLLDQAGNLWCNGYDVDLNGSSAREISWEMSHDTCRKAPTITPQSGSTVDPSTLGGLCNVTSAKTVTFRIKETHSAGSAGAVYIDEWETDASGTWTDVSPADLHDVYGITFTYSTDGGFYIGWAFYVNLAAKSDIAQGNPTLIRMGSDVLICQGKPLYWCNAVKLASGSTMVAGTDYGRIDCDVEVYLSAYVTTLTLCDIDGNAYSGVVVSATEPTQEGYWLDISGDKPALQEWSVSQSMWVKLTSTYVKIAGIPLIGARTWDSSPLKKGDAATFSTKDLDGGTDPLVVQLLNSTHYLYDTGTPVGEDPYMIVAGILPADTVTVNTGYAVVTRSVPNMDFVVEAQNRLWGCRYDEAKSINEIYASKLGDFRNWDVYQGLSTDSWRASRGKAAPFTGAIALSGYPLFFREESLEKVFPSSSGAHQIATYDLEGVQKGSDKSMVIIDERLFYKGRNGVCVYSGTLPVRISDAFDADWKFYNASAGRDGHKYCVCMDQAEAPDRLCMVYDLDTGDWHPEDEPWANMAVTWKDAIYYLQNGSIWRRGGSNADGVSWFAESDELAMELPEHKWITYVRIRFKLDLKAECRLYAAFDSGEWERKAALHGNHMGTREVTIWPRRCDHFRLRLEGTGGCEIQSISYRVERSEGGH